MTVETGGPDYFQLAVMAKYRAGMSVPQIANLLGCSRSHVTKTACRMRRQGFYVPYNFIRTPDRKKKYPRFTATGITATGHRISATGDSQTFVNEHIKAMVADDQNKEV